MLYIFDWDGTICDSTGKIVECMQKTIVELNLPELSDGAIKNIIGLGLPEAINTLYPGTSVGDYERIKTCYSGYFLETKETRADLFPNALETLVKLKDQGYSLAVATGKSRAGLDRILKHVDMAHLFDETRCADETQSKPHPLMLEELLLAFDCRPEQAIMIGDTEYDMAMAKNASMPKIGVSFGAHEVERLHKYDPVLCVDRFEDILNWRF